MLLFTLIPGTPSIWDVSKLTEGVRVTAYKPDMMNVGGSGTDDSYIRALYNISRKCTLMLLSSHCEIFPAFYDRRHYHNVLKCTDRLVNLGRTSYQHLTEVESIETGKLLHRLVAQLVCVDSKSRRPVEIPQEDRLLLEKNTQKYNMEKIASLQKPETTHCSERRVYPSDTDYYFHLNQSVYLRICHDAMTEASLDGTFSRLKGDLAQYRIRYADTLILAENLPGDNLDVHCWENKNNPFLVESIAYKIGKPVFQCSIEFAAETPLIE